MTLCNLHTHTNRSDGKCSAEDVVLTAIEKGFRTLGFSDHVHTPFIPTSTLPSDPEEYIRENLSLAERYRGELEIVCGIENEFDCWHQDIRFQYTIGSRHSMVFGEKHLLIDESPELFEQGVGEFFGGDFRAAVTDYYRRLPEDISRFHPDIMGHMDIIRKFNRAGRFFDENAGWYRKAAMEAVEAIGDSGTVFEVNTSSIARKRRRILYPADFILRFILQRGYPVILSSDSHDPVLLDGEFENTRRHLLDIGFRSIMVWKDGGFTGEELLS